jgi:hypothetical protein
VVGDDRTEAVEVVAQLVSRATSAQDKPLRSNT